MVCHEPVTALAYTYFMVQKTDPYTESLKANLSPKAKAWLESYKPRNLTWVDRFIAMFHGDLATTRPATMEKDEAYLVMLAQQCDAQGVEFPKRVGLYEKPVWNASYVPLTKSFIATEGIVEQMEKSKLHSVIAHEVGHGKQGYRTLLTSVAAYLFTRGAMIGLERRVLPMVGVDSRHYRDTKPGVDLGIQAAVHAARWYVNLFAISQVSKWFEYDADMREAMYGDPKLAADSLRSLVSDKSVEAYRKYRENRTPAQRIWGVVHDIIFPFSMHPKLEDRIERLEKAHASRQLVKQAIEASEGTVESQSFAAGNVRRTIQIFDKRPASLPKVDWGTRVQGNDTEQPSASHSLFS